MFTRRHRTKDAPTVGLSVEEQCHSLTVAEFCIDDFTAKLPQLEDVVKSPTFPAFGLPEWQIHVKPRGDTKHKFGVHLFLVKAEKGREVEMVHCKMCFLDDDRKVLSSVQTTG